MKTFHCRCGKETLEVEEFPEKWLEERTLIDSVINLCFEKGGACKPVNREAIDERIAQINAEAPSVARSTVGATTTRGRRKLDKIAPAMKEHKKRGRKPLSDEEKEERKRQYLALHPNSGRKGRPVGSKNKSTLAKLGMV